MTGRDEHGRFVASTEEIIDAEVIDETPGTELAVIPEPSGLLQTLWNDVEASVWNFEIGRTARLIAVIERLFPELHTSSGRRHAFAWPECPTYEPLLPPDETAVGSWGLADQTIIR